MNNSFGDALIVEHIGDEAIVYDPHTDEVHHLDAAATTLYARATDDLSRRNLLRGGLVATGAAVTTMLASTAASALCIPGTGGPLSTPYDLFTEITTVVTASTRQAPATTAHYSFFQAANASSTFTAMTVNNPTTAANFFPAPTSTTAAVAATGTGLAAGSYAYAVVANATGPVRASLAGPCSDIGFPASHNVDVGWSAVAGASTYTIYRAPIVPATGFGAWRRLTTAATGTSFTDTGTAGTAATPPFLTWAGADDNIGEPVFADFSRVTFLVHYGTVNRQDLVVGFTVPAGVGTGTGVRLEGNLTNVSPGQLTIKAQDASKVDVPGATVNVASGAVGSFSFQIPAVATGNTLYVRVLGTTGTGDQTGLLVLGAY